MKALTVVILTGLVFGFVCFMRWFFKGLTAFVAEAWQSDETEQRQNWGPRQ